MKRTHQGILLSGFPTCRQFLSYALAASVAGCLALRATAQEDKLEISADAVPTNTVVATIPVGAGPQFVTINSQDTFVYVVNSNNTVSAINTATNKVIGTWSAGATPLGLAVTPDGTQLYVTSSTAAGAVTILNASTGAVIKTIAVDGNPGFLQISPDGGSAFVPSDLTGTVTVIDTASQTIKTKISIGINADSVAFTPSGNFAYVTDPRGKEVAVIDTATLTVSHVLRIHAATGYVAVNPAGTQDVFVLDGADAAGIPQQITVIKGDKVIKTLTIRDAHIGFFAITPNGKYAYVPDTYHGGAPYNYVRLLNTTTYNDVGKMIQVGNKPLGVAIAHNGAYAYVTNYQDNTVSVIKISPAQ